MFHTKRQVLSHWSARHCARLASSRGACREEQSTHELLILACSTLLARRRARIPALSSVPGSTVKGSTHQVMGCGRGGMQITMVPFQLSALKGGIHCLPDPAPAPGHSPQPSQPCCTPTVAHHHRPGRAGHLYPASGAQGQESSIQVIHRGLLGPLHDCLYKKMQLQEETPFLCISIYVKTSMRQYSLHKRSFMFKSHPISLGLIIAQLRQLQR